MSHSHLHYSPWPVFAARSSRFWTCNVQFLGLFRTSKTCFWSCVPHASSYHHQTRTQPRARQGYCVIKLAAVAQPSSSAKSLALDAGTYISHEICGSKVAGGTGCRGVYYMPVHILPPSTASSADASVPIRVSHFPCQYLRQDARSFMFNFPFLSISPQIRGAYTYNRKRLSGSALQYRRGMTPRFRTTMAIREPSTEVGKEHIGDSTSQEDGRCLSNKPRPF